MLLRVVNGNTDFIPISKQPRRITGAKFSLGDMCRLADNAVNAQYGAFGIYVYSQTLRMESPKMSKNKYGVVIRVFVDVLP